MTMVSTKPNKKRRTHMTKREMDVLTLIGQGYSSKQAAESLYVLSLIHI